MKICAKCNQTLDLDLFHKNSRSKDGRCSYCKACALLTTNEWRKSNPEKKSRNNRNYSLRHREKLSAKRRIYEKAFAMKNPEEFLARRRRYARRWVLKGYGLTLETLVEKLQAQGAMCAICLNELSLETAVVDHCHSTGATRDLLCSKCNTKLGHIEQPEFVEKALAYIERHRKLWIKSQSEEQVVAKQRIVASAEQERQHQDV